MTIYTDWRDLRALVYATVEADLRPRFPDLRLTPLDFTALTAAKPWWQAKQIGWEWPAVTKRPKANRFELAVWHGEILCGLAYGPATGDWVAIEFLQGNPDPGHPLKRHIIKIAVAVLETQALTAGAAEMRLLRPFPELIEVYERRGYLPVAEAVVPAYLRKTRISA